MRIAYLMLMFAVNASAHDVHRSTAEAEYNAATAKLEVSLTVFVSDLELALVRQTEREMSLAKTPAAELDMQIQRYLGRTFTVTDSAGKPAPLHWVGRKIDPATEASGDPELTLFFEVPLPDGFKGASLRHAVLCDCYADQINLVHLRSEGRSAELRFTRGSEKAALLLPK